MAFQTRQLRALQLAAGTRLGGLLISALCAGPGSFECTVGAWKEAQAEGTLPQLAPHPGPLVHATSLQCPLLLPGCSVLGEPCPHSPTRTGEALLSHFFTGRITVEKDASVVARLRLLRHFWSLPGAISLSLSWCLWSPPRVPGPCVQGGVSTSHPLSCPQAASHHTLLCVCSLPQCVSLSLCVSVVMWPLCSLPPGAAFLTLWPLRWAEGQDAPLGFCSRIMLQLPLVVAVVWAPLLPLPPCPGLLPPPAPRAPLPYLVLETLSLALFLGLSS